nr:MAG TPA: hypothetical protein [Caudoviricetes sp.]
MVPSIPTGMIKGTSNVPDGILHGAEQSDPLLRL